MPGGGGHTQPASREARGQSCLGSRGWRAPTFRACHAGHWWGGTGSGGGPHLPFEAAAQPGLKLCVDSRHLWGEEVGMGPACPYLPHAALTWPQRPGLGGLGGQGLPQLRGPPIPSSPLTPKAGQREGLTILGLGVSGRDVPSPAWRSPGIRGRGISAQSLGPAGESGGPSPQHGGLVTTPEL